MKNTLSDLNNHLFAQLERLSDEELQGEELAQEIGRSRAVMGVAKGIIENGALVLEGQKFVDNQLSADVKLPRMLEGDK